MVKEVIKSVIGIFITIAVVVLSIPLWENSFASKNIAIINEYKDIPVSVDYDGTVAFSDDEYEFDNLYIKNYTNNNEVKTLYFVIDKSSTIKGDNMSIIINNKEYELKKTLKQEENNKTLFKLDDFTIDAYDSINLETKVLLDKNTDVSDDDTLEISFEVK